MTKRTGANIVGVAEDIKVLTEGGSQDWPDGVTYRILADQSEMISDMVSELQNNILTALILVVGVILFFLALLQLLRQTLGQNIWSDRANAILPQSNNLKEVGQYEFFMKLQTRISVSPKIVLTFPSDLFPVVL